jgi:hypothetical protein
MSQEPRARDPESGARKWGPRAWSHQSGVNEKSQGPGARGQELAVRSLESGATRDYKIRSQEKGARSLGAGKRESGLKRKELGAWREPEKWRQESRESS